MKKNVLFLVMSFLLGAMTPLSIKAQPCPGANRQLSNSKAQTQYDAIGASLKNFLSDGTNAAWLWESGATFVENTDGTARLRGVLRSFERPTTHRLDVDITFIGQTYTPPMGSPVLMNTTPASTAGWYYYEWGTASMTGLNSLAGAKVNLAKRGKSLQVGIGGSDQVPDIGIFGGTGWFTWTVVSQPTNSAIKIQPFPTDPTVDQADLVFTLSGTPTNCSDPCANASAPSFTNCSSTALTYTAGASGCADISYTNPTASGATVVVESGPASGTCQKAGSYEVVFKATNSCNKIARCTLKIVVNPYVDPCANAAGPSFSNCSSTALTYTAGASGCADISYTNPTAAGATVVVESGPASGTCQKAGSYEVVFKATNSCNKIARCTLKIVVNPYVDPCANAAVPSFSNCSSTALTYTAGASGCADISYTNPTASGATVVIESGPASGTCQKAGSYEVIFKATNSCNKIARCTLKIVVNPYVDPCANATAPSFSNCSSTALTYTAGASGCAVISYTNPTASGATVVVESGPASGTCQQAGSYEVIFKATNSCNKTARCTLKIVVNPYVDPCRGEPMPTFNDCPTAAYTFTAASNGCAVITYDRPRASGAMVTLESGPESGTCQKAGTYTAIFKATDWCDRFVKCTVTIVVKPYVDPCNNEPAPAFTDCPTSAYTFTAASNGCAVITYDRPRAPGAMVTQESGPETGSCQKAGTYTAIFKATDWCDRFAKCTVTIIIKPYVDPCNNEPAPAFTDCPTSAYTFTAASNGCAVITYDRPRAPGAMVTQESGPETGSCQKAGTYTAIFKATDWCDRFAKCTVTIVVKPYVDPCGTAADPSFSNCPSSTSTYTAASNGCAVISYTNPTASGATVVVESGPASGSCQQAGTYNVIFKATNDCNKTARCTLKIVVNPYVDPCTTDTEKPKFTGCPSNITMTIAGDCEKVFWTAPKATDNCSTPTITLTTAPVSNRGIGSCFEAGVHTITYTATDAKGNTAICSFTITITTTCAQVTNPGTIKGDDSFCPGGTISPVLSTSSASGGSGELDYLWMYSTASSTFDQNSWTIITGETGESLMNMPSLTRTAYFIRCVRRKGCNLFKESNVVTKTARAFAEITGPYDACVGAELTFTATESPVALYSWFFEGANISTAYTQTVKVKFNSTGAKKIRLEVSSPGCLRTTSHLIEIKSCLTASGTMNALKATVINTGTVRLNWATKNELLPSMYIVEKSADGKNFIEIADVKSQNNETNDYRFDDNEPKMGRGFYRIKHLESDGKLSFSTIEQTLIYINGGDPVMAYPNPITNRLFIELLDSQNTEGVIEIYNTVGKLLKTQKYSKDQVRYELNTENLETGTYIVKIRQADGVVKSVKVSKF